MDMTLTKCENCGIQFEFETARLRRGRGRFCGHRCASSRPRADTLSKEKIARRFWAKVDKAGECWIWTGHRLPKGYGTLGVGDKNKKATHVSILLDTGAFPPDGSVVAHSCDNPPCVRPDHLFVTTHAGNAADRDQKGRWRSPMLKGEKVGSSRLTEDEVRAILASPLGCRRLASQFGVSKANVQAIRRGRSWRHLQADSSSL